MLALRCMALFPGLLATRVTATASGIAAAAAVSTDPLITRFKKLRRELMIARLDKALTVTATVGPIGKQMELASVFGIRAIPIAMAFKNGRLVFSQPGLLPKAALARLIERYAPWIWKLVASNRMVGQAFPWPP